MGLVVAITVMRAGPGNVGVVRRGRVGVDMELEVRQKKGLAPVRRIQGVRYILRCTPADKKAIAQPMLS